MCNRIVKEFKQKQTGQQRFVENFEDGISNNHIENDSVCLLLSLEEQNFCDIHYVTQTYKKVLGSDIELERANLRDILIPETADIHQSMIRSYFSNMEASYLGTHREGLISLKEKLLERVHYIV